MPSIRDGAAVFVAQEPTPEPAGSATVCARPRRPETPAGAAYVQQWFSTGSARFQAPTASTIACSVGLAGVNGPRSPGCGTTSGAPWRESHTAPHALRGPCNHRGWPPDPGAMQIRWPPLRSRCRPRRRPRRQRHAAPQRTHPARQPSCRGPRRRPRSHRCRHSNGTDTCRPCRPTPRTCLPCCIPSLVAGNREDASIRVSVTARRRNTTTPTSNHHLAAASAAFTRLLTRKHQGRLDLRVGPNVQSEAAPGPRPPSITCVGSGPLNAPVAPLDHCP
jgi:hypothetical protein